MLETIISKITLIAVIGIYVFLTARKGHLKRAFFVLYAEEFYNRRNGRIITPNKNNRTAGSHFIHWDAYKKTSVKTEASQNVYIYLLR